MSIAMFFFFFQYIYRTYQVGTCSYCEMMTFSYNH